MPYPDNHNPAAQDRAMGSGTGPGRVWIEADYQRQADLIREGMRAAQARLDAKATHTGHDGVTIRGGSGRATVTRERIGVFVQVAHDGSLGTETVLIPPDMVAGVADALRGMA